MNKKQLAICAFLVVMVMVFESVTESAFAITPRVGLLSKRIKVEVCIDRPKMDFESLPEDQQASRWDEVFRSKSIPARFQRFVWVNDNTGERIAAGYTDHLGRYGKVDIVNENGDAVAESKFTLGVCKTLYLSPDKPLRSSIRMQPFYPKHQFDNYENGVPDDAPGVYRVKPISLPEFRVSLNTPPVVHLTAPDIREEVFPHTFNDREITNTSVPLLYTHAFFNSETPFSDGSTGMVQERYFSGLWEGNYPDGSDFALVDAALSGNSNGLRAFSPGPDFPRLNYHEDKFQMRLHLSASKDTVVVGYLKTRFDYESCAMTLATAQDEEPLASYLGLDDCVGGAYSNFKIYVAKASTVKSFFPRGDFCSTAPLTYMEDRFKRAIEIGGGVNGGMLPGMYFSGSTTLSEHFNTAESSGEFDEDGYTTDIDLGKDGAAVEIFYKNLPIWIPNQMGDEPIAILVVEGDDNVRNDVVMCHESLDIGGDVYERVNSDSITRRNDVRSTSLGRILLENIDYGPVFELLIKSESGVTTQYR